MSFSKVVLGLVSYAGVGALFGAGTLALKRHVEQNGNDLEKRQLKKILDEGNTINLTDEDLEKVMFVIAVVAWPYVLVGTAFLKVKRLVS